MTTKSDPGIAPDAKPINLALQGGGAHGAFTWGVLDRFLEDKRIQIAAISGTSAGAMNAAVLADGLMRGGPEGGREKLRQFWELVGRRAAFSPIRRNPLDVMFGNWGLAYSPGYWWFDALTHSVSPYDFNPLNINPLREILEEVVDFELVRSCREFPLFVSATNVETGRVRVFAGESLTSDVVMASACLPTLFHAVEIDGEHYWDGGYMGNPVLFPFFSTNGTNDILIVQINPIEHKGVPRTSRDILDRINEISFNSSLLRELRAVDFVRRMLDEERLDAERYRNLHIHIVGLHNEGNEFGAPSKLNAEPAFLEHLFQLGRSAAANWLEENFDAIGERSTVDIRRMFQGDGYEPAV
ncbi:MAG: patatin-like phospholipase family protein [Rhodomicrobiaceae bacterium]